jgi:hypothetical protein
MHPAGSIAAPRGPARRLLPGHLGQPGPKGARRTARDSLGWPSAPLTPRWHMGGCKPGRLTAVHATIMAWESD